MSYGIGAVVVNPSLTPFGGFVDAGGNPLYNTPESLAGAINANYQAQGVAARVSSDQVQQYFKGSPSPPLSNVPSADYTPPAAHVNPPPAASTSTNALATMNSYAGVPPMGQDPSFASGFLQKIQDAISSTAATGSGTSTTPGAPAPVGTSGLTIILAVVGIGVALMMSGGKGKYED